MMGGRMPEGFALIGAGPGFVRLCGDFFMHEERPALGARIGPEHLNPAGVAHGGLLVTLADSAINAVIRRDHGVQRPLTISLSVDFLDAVRQGDWVEASVALHKVGSRITNASCMMTVDDRPVLRASGVFLTSALERTESITPCT